MTEVFILLQPFRFYNSEACKQTISESVQYVYIIACKNVNLRNLVSSTALCQPDLLRQGPQFSSGEVSKPQVNASTVKA